MKWEVLDGKTLPQGQRQLRFRRTAGDSDSGAGGDRSKPNQAPPPVLVELSPSDDTCGTSGIVAIELTSATGERYTVTRTAQNHAKLEIPIAPPRSVKLDSRSTAELCIAAVGPRGRDPLMRRCLTLAARLGERLEP
jgi:hypothetical protein